MAAQSKKDVCCEEKGGDTKIDREMGNWRDTLKEKGLKNKEKSIERKKTQKREGSTEQRKEGVHLSKVSAEQWREREKVQLSKVSADQRRERKGSIERLCKEVHKKRDKGGKRQHLKSRIKRKGRKRDGQVRFTNKIISSSFLVHWKNVIRKTRKRLKREEFERDGGRDEEGWMKWWGGLIKTWNAVTNISPTENQERRSNLRIPTNFSNLSLSIFNHLSLDFKFLFRKFYGYKFVLLFLSLFSRKFLSN